jgi:hypothetical protein
MGMFRGDHPVELWDLRIGGVVQYLDEAGEIDNEIAFSPDGRWLAAVSDDRGIGASMGRSTD